MLTLDIVTINKLDYKIDFSIYSSYYHFLHYTKYLTTFICGKWGNLYLFSRKLLCGTSLRFLRKWGSQESKENLFFELVYIYKNISDILYKYK